MKITRIKSTGLYIALGMINNQIIYAVGYTRLGALHKAFLIANK